MRENLDGFEFPDGYNIVPMSPFIGGFVPCPGEPEYKDGTTSQEVYINDDYWDECINDDKAKDLLNNYIHETIHYNQYKRNTFMSGLSMYLICNEGDGISVPHKAVHEWGDRLVEELFDKYNKRRKDDQEYKEKCGCSK